MNAFDQVCHPRCRSHVVAACGDGGICPLSYLTVEACNRDAEGPSKSIGRNHRPSQLRTFLLASDVV